MQFHEFGDKKNPTLLCMHGMMQRWESEYELLKPLEAHYRLIIPAMDGFYDGSGTFTSFADQARQIEEYILRHYGGILHGAYGASQGGLMLVELLTRKRIAIKTVVMDGVYVAHQGAASGWVTYRMFCKFKNTGSFPALIHVMMKLMGVKLENMLGDLETSMYLKASDESVKRNFMENYTYHARPEIAHSTAKVYLWCGSKEPYAIKSHNILKKYLRNYEETIFDGYGHGEMLLKHNTDMCKRIKQAIQ